MAARAARSALPFATIDLATNKAVGSTRHHHIEGEHRRLEIGVTWIGTAFQRTHINTEAKLLQLWYAFDVLKCRRVELKADVHNEKSRTAILRLGAVQEGIFRKHMIYADGRNRDNVYSRSSTTSGGKFARDSKTSSAILSRRHSRKRP